VVACGRSHPFSSADDDHPDDDDDDDDGSERGSDRRSMPPDATRGTHEGSSPEIWRRELPVRAPEFDGVLEKLPLRRIARETTRELRSAVCDCIFHREKI